MRYANRLISCNFYHDHYVIKVQLHHHSNGWPKQKLKIHPFILFWTATASISRCTSFIFIPLETLSICHSHNWIPGICRSPEFVTTVSFIFPIKSPGDWPVVITGWQTTVNVHIGCTQNSLPWHITGEICEYSAFSVRYLWTVLMLCYIYGCQCVKAKLRD